jgi:phage/plasmid-like protein (TIGR03299 family)
MTLETSTAPRMSAFDRLGTPLGGLMTATEALERAGLAGWNVRKAPLFLQNGTELMDRFATVRGPEDAPAYLGVVGKQYTPIQNEAHTDVMDALVDESGANFLSAGDLDGGRKVFVNMKLPNTIQVGGIDPVDLNLAAFTSHDGSSAFKLAVHPMRVFCANQQTAVLKAARSTFSIRHTSGHREAITAAREALGITFNYVAEFEQAAERMIQETMTEIQFQGIVEQLTGKVDPESSKRTVNRLQQEQDDLMQLFTESPTSTAIRGTRWGAYQAFTEYADHFAPVRTIGDREYARALRVASGGADDFKSRAFELTSVELGTPAPSPERITP